MNVLKIVFYFVTFGFVAILPDHSLAFSEKIIKTDLKNILKQANLPSNSLSFKFSKSQSKNFIKIQCHLNRVVLDVASSDQEKVSTFYYGLFKLGFYFPHPRWQISPSQKQIFNHCNKTYHFVPQLSSRGFHLHTQHPSEWVAGFFMDKPDIANEIILWNARNMQNILQIQLIRTPWKELKRNFSQPFDLARALNIRVGVSLSFAMAQQKSFKLIPFFPAISGVGDLFYLKRNMKKLLSSIDADFYTLELGTTEFTSTRFKRTLNWVNTLHSILKKKNKKMFVKIHVSGGQDHKDLGNFNFLPEHASDDIGVLPHTVMFYSLTDSIAPMYGQKNFKHIYDFAKRSAEKRTTWYYPETSYYIGLDIDVPLLLTDYLKARNQDFTTMDELNIDGQINFTTGQELGYWLFDWSVALFNLMEHRKKPLIALELLGEPLDEWVRILNFQNKYFKKDQLIQTLSTSNLQDELRILGPIHKRILLKDLRESPVELNREIKKLTNAIQELPPIDRVKNLELKLMLQVTWNRIFHALELRQALKYQNNLEKFAYHLGQAKWIRLRSQEILSELQKNFSRYKEVPIFKPFKNPTSYPYGYGWTAATLYYWEREEKIVKNDIANPFFMNAIFDPFQILF